jgi:peptide/nickel transport system ATP-binding protein
MNATPEFVLEARELQVAYATRNRVVTSLDGASLAVRRGEVHALVGESGSGKSTLGMATGRLLAANAHYTGGSLQVDGRSVLDASARELRALRRDTLGYVFQNPIASLDPTMRIARQMHFLTRDQSADLTSSEALERVGLQEVSRVLRSFPHELSGGMAQRVCIAMALSRNPRLLIADEPTAAVDATIRPQLLSLLTGLCKERGCALLLLTHDLQAVREYADNVSVMFAGKVVESGAAHSVLDSPSHPYTRALLSAQPGNERPGERLEAIRYDDLLAGVGGKEARA